MTAGERATALQLLFEIRRLLADIRHQIPVVD
jgi:hypothetical protein